MKRSSGAKSAPRTRPGTIARNGDPNPPAAAERRRDLAAAAIVGGAVVALLAMVFGPHRIGDYFTETDFYGAYAEGARAIQRGHVDPARYGVIGPLYEFALALSGFVVRDLFLAAQLISTLAVAVTLWCTHRIARRLAGGRVALATLLVLAVNPYLFRYGYAATTDALALALQSGALAVLLLVARPGAAFAAGVLAALAFLTRYNAIVLLPAGVAIAALGGTPQANRVRAALGVAAGFLLPVVPWIAWSLGHGGAFSFQLHHNIAYEVYAHALGIPWDTYQREMQSQFHSLGDVIAKDPAAVAGRMVTNLFAHAVSNARSLTGWPVAAGALLGVAFGWRDGSLRRAWPVWLAAGPLYATLVPVFYSERYALVLLPAIALLAGIAFGSPALAFAVRPARGAWLKAGALALVLAASLYASWQLQARTLDQLPIEVLEVARVAERLKAPGDRVIARKSHLAYHAGLEPLPFPFDTTLAGLAATAHRTRARWLYFSWPEAETRPAFFHLLDTTGVVPGLTVRVSTSPRPAVLYEIGPEFGRAPAWYANDTLRAYHALRGRLAVDGRDGDACYNLAVVLRAMHRTQEAMVYAERARTLLPRRAEPTILLGILALDAGDAEGAGRAFERVLSRDPTNEAALLGMGWSRSALGDARGAAAAWRAVLDVTDDPATLARMIEVFDEAGDAQAAAGARARRAALARLP